MSSLLFLLLGSGAGAGAGYFFALRKGAEQAAELEALRASTTDLKAKLKKRDEEVKSVKKTLEETRKAAQDYQSQQGAWARDRDETLRALNEERTAHQGVVRNAASLSAQLRQAQDEHQRVARELGQQVESLTRSGQKSQAEMAALVARGRGYAEFQREVAEAFNYIQGEVGRTETSAAIGHLLSYSSSALMETVANPNPVLARAMLSNIDRIAAAFPSVPHARKLAATAQRLSAELGQGAIPESTQPHAHARYFDEALRLLRHQRGLEISPFYFGLDGAGAVHAVYV